MPKTMKLLEWAQITINKNTNCETPLLEILELVFVYYDIVNNSCLHDSRVMYAFIPNKLIGQLLDVSVNVTKSAGNCGFGHIYWRNP